MGLDMYAYSTKTPIPHTDFDEAEDSQLIAQWRKHPNLHGWMEALYFFKGGKEDSFNCVTLKLEPLDIAALETFVLSDALPQTTGFFFGESQPEDKSDDIAFIAAARKAFDEGKSVFYTSWW